MKQVLFLWLILILYSCEDIPKEEEQGPKSLNDIEFYAPVSQIPVLKFYVEGPDLLIKASLAKEALPLEERAKVYLNAFVLEKNRTKKFELNLQAMPFQAQVQPQACDTDFFSGPLCLAGEHVDVLLRAPLSLEQKTLLSKGSLTSGFIEMAFGRERFRRFFFQVEGKALFAPEASFLSTLNAHVEEESSVPIYLFSFVQEDLSMSGIQDIKKSLDKVWAQCGLTSKIEGAFTFEKNYLQSFAPDFMAAEIMPEVISLIRKMRVLSRKRPGLFVFLGLPGVFVDPKAYPETLEGMKYIEQEEKLLETQTPLEARTKTKEGPFDILGVALKYLKSEYVDLGLLKEEVRKNDIAGLLFVDQDYSASKALLAHELGHLLGLTHREEEKNLMSPYYTDENDYLTQEQCEEMSMALGEMF